MALDWNDQGGRSETVDASSEVCALVKPKIWKAAGMEEMSGCLCIGCLERRIGRMLAAEDFLATIRSTRYAWNGEGASP